VDFCGGLVALSRLDDAGARPRIGVDGFNLAMVRGTGVATYARNLCLTLSAMGHPLDGVFGFDVSRAKSDALREVLFFSALDQGGEARIKRTFRRRIGQALISPFPRRLLEAPLRGQVIAEVQPGRSVRGGRALFPSIRPLHARPDV
jgi:hypothetical protein